MRKTKPAQNPLPGNTEERILSQSIRLFLEKGYHGTSIDDITQSAGLTKGALYWHFKSKEDLLRRIVKEYEKHFLDGLIRAVEEVRDGAFKKFEKYIRYNAAFAYHNRDLCASFDTLAVELVGAHHKIEPEIKRIYRKYENFLSQLILQGKKEKIFKKDLNTKLAALILIAFQDGILIQWSMNREKIDGEAYVNTFKKMVLKGLMN